MNLVESVEVEQMKEDIPDFRPGDTVRVHVKVIEGDRERLQAFEGVVMARGKGGLKEHFRVRRVTHGVGVERVFLAHSPRIARIEVLRRGKVRQGKLYYLREKVGKAARIKEQRMK